MLSCFQGSFGRITGHPEVDHQTPGGNVNFLFADHPAE